MATPRKHWFKVADSILRERLTVEQRGILVGLMAYLNGQWARDGLNGDQACRATLSQGALKDITGRSQVAHAVTALRLLGEVVSIQVDSDGEYAEIYWPKFAIFQGLESGIGETQGKKSPPPRRKTQDADAKKKEEKNAPSERAAEPLTPPDPIEQPAEPEAEPGPSPAPKPLLNFLSKLDGEPEEKRRWFEVEWPLIEVEARGDKHLLKSLTIRFYRRYLTGDRRFLREIEDERKRAELDAIKAAHGIRAGPPPPQADPGPLLRRVMTL